MNRKFKKKVIFYMLLIFCVLGILCSLYILFCDNKQYANAKNTYNKVREVRKRDISTESEITDNINFKNLIEINKDLVGWITIKNTVIDYPIVKGKDNKYYLNHLFTGENNKCGSLFMDYRCNINFSDKNTIIYGHNMKDGSMLSSINNYKKQGYYDKFPYMILYTNKGKYKIQIFAGIILDGSNDSILFKFKDNKEFQNYIDFLKIKSTFKSNVIIKNEDSIITMCTCSYETDNSRYILCGKLVNQN